MGALVLSNAFFAHPTAHATMKAFLSLAVAASISLSEALIYNKTAAYAPGNYEKYKCITTEDINDMFPACLRQCQRDANSQDGCAYNDFACHCANYDVYSPLVEECAFPPELGGTGNCTLPELGQARQVVTDLCNFFNATGYTASAECGHGGWGGRKGGWVVEREAVTEDLAMPTAR